MKAILFICFAFIAMSFSNVNAQEKQPKIMEVTMQTSAECGDCKERIENKLNYTKGVIYSDLDVRTKKLTVKYKTSKITLDEIKTIVSNIGYTIDDVEANPEAVNKLPECCQPGGHK